MNSTPAERTARIDKLARTIVGAFVGADEDTIARSLAAVVGSAALSSSNPQEWFDTFRGVLHAIIGDKGEAVMKAMPVAGRA